MQGMKAEQALDWCESAGLAMNEDSLLSYETASERRFFIAVPDGFRNIMILARAMIIFEGEPGFSGGLPWLRSWDVGSPQLVRVGWQIMEDMRRARGDMQSLDIAPAQHFRDDELVALHAFLVQVAGLGLVADFVPASRRFYVHFKDNAQICFTTDEADTLQQLRTTFSQWNPTDEDPVTMKIREFERQHEKEAK
jgi:hypothetical protein